MTASSGGTASGAVASEVLSARLVEAALEYAALGWRVVPLHNVLPNGACSCRKGLDCPEKSRGKHPRPNEWQKLATSDEQTIRLWWKKWPLANVGVTMGQGSGLVDFEYDTPEEEQEYVRLFDGNPPVTVCFQSARGKHPLYRWNDRLPPKGVVKLGLLKVRVGNEDLGAMSVFPPSVHAMGVAYKWILHPNDCAIAEIPQTVIAKLWNLQGEPLLALQPEGKSEEEWDRILAGVPEGERNQDMAAYCGLLLGQARDVSRQKSVRVLYQAAEAINARNRPPLSEKELKTIFSSILKREQAKRAAEQADGVMGESPDKQVEKAHSAVTGQPAETGAFKLVIVESDPPRYELHAPQFRNAKGSCIVLTAEQMNNARAIRIQALKQAEYPMPKGFDKAWAKKDGLYEKLVFTAEHREAPEDEKRGMIVAERLVTHLSKPRILKEGETADTRGKPCKLPDGSIVFLFTRVWEDLSLGADKITRNELSEVLQEVNVGCYREGGLRFKRLAPEAIERLRARGN